MTNFKLYNNYERLFENSYTIKNMDLNNQQLKIISFQRLNTINKKVFNRLPFVNLITSISTKKNNYVFKYNKRHYPFKILSEENIQKIDKKILTSKEINNENDLIRILKMACSMDLINPKVIIYNSKIQSSGCLISYQKNGVEKIIDYTKNIIMNKNDYSELFPYNEINSLSKDDLYRIYIFIKETAAYNLLPYFLLFSKEMLKDLSKNEIFKEISNTNNFDFTIINKKNASILGRFHDYLYFENRDNNPKYRKERIDLDNFTLNSNQTSPYITYNNKTKKYIFKNKKFGTFEFSRLSDYITNKQIKDDLFSINRYHKCHANSIIVIYSLNNKNKESALLAAGKIKVNDIDYVYHSWVEIDNKDVVIDYNHNLIMSRKKFYKLYEAIAIQKTPFKDLQKILNYIVNKANLKINCSIVNYFGQEIYEDLLKNEKIFIKK